MTLLCLLFCNHSVGQNFAERELTNRLIDIFRILARKMLVTTYVGTDWNIDEVKLWENQEV